MRDFTYITYHLRMLLMLRMGNAVVFFFWRCVPVSEKEPVGREDFFKAVETLMQFGGCFVVCLLSRGKAALVDAIVDVGVNPAIYLVNHALQMRGAEVYLWGGIRATAALDAIEHAHEIGTLVGNHLALLLVLLGDGFS